MEHPAGQQRLEPLLDELLAERDRLRAENARQREALQSGIASFEQFVRLGRIPENNKGLRDMRIALAESLELLEVIERRNA